MVNTSPAPSLEEQVFVLVVVTDGAELSGLFQLARSQGTPYSIAVRTSPPGQCHSSREDNRESKIKIDDKGAFAVFQIGTLQQYIIARKRPKEEFLQRSIIRTDIFLNFWSQILACCHADEEA